MSPMIPPCTHRPSRVATEEVQLRFPARLEYVRLTRLVVSGLATQVAFSVDEIEDIRIAVDELCSTVIDHCADDGEVVVTFHVGDSTIRMCASALSIDEEVELDELSDHILRATVDAHSVELEGELIVARMERSCAAPVS